MKSILETHPEVAKQWHPTKNGTMKPENYTFGSGKKVWWLCEKKCPEKCLHEWETTILSRCRDNRNCPYCCNQKICFHTSIVTTNKEIVNQWHPTKNGDLKPYQFSFGSDKKIWWLCDKNILHEWEAKISGRCRGSKCPYCCNQKCIINNSIVTTHPEIVKQWHPTKNRDLKPEMFTFGSGEKVWWLCEKKCPEGCLHEWKTTIVKRCQKNRNCPYCAIPSKITCIHTSILETNPEIAKQWHPTKNRDLKPEMFTFGSGEKVWWLCEKNILHEWETSISKRSRGDGCPHCKNKTQDKLHKYLLKKFSGVITEFKTEWCKSSITNKNYSFDFLIKKFNIIIELDGPQHFYQIQNWLDVETAQQRDVYKMKKALEKNFTIIRILQEDVWKNQENWLDENLLPKLVAYEKEIVIYIDNKNLYENHKKLMELI
jgi:very-short-patch-repair endonuclease